MTKLTMITVNGNTKFVRLPVDADGKVRISQARLFRMFGIRRDDCRVVCFGR